MTENEDYGKDPDPYQGPTEPGDGQPEARAADLLDAYPPPPRPDPGHGRALLDESLALERAQRSEMLRARRDECARELDELALEHAVDEHAGQRGPLEQPALLELLSKIAADDPRTAAKLLGHISGVETNPIQYPGGTKKYRWSDHKTPLLDAAKARAQGGVRNAFKNRTNEHLRNDYADISAVYEACLRACSDAGLAIYQSPHGEAGGLVVTTRLACDGEWMEADFLVKVEHQKGVNSKQAIGISLTYAKRYALAAMLNIGTGDDTDGADPAPAPTRTNPLQAKWSDAVAAFGELSPKVNPAQILKALGRSSVNDVNNDDHDRLKALYQRLVNGEPFESLVG